MPEGFTIKLYTVTDDNNKVDKTLGTAKEYTGSIMKTMTDVTAPTIRIQSAENLSGINYCYIERYGRYYFVNRIRTTPNGMWEIDCRCDVLMSYKSEILSLTGTLERSETQYNGYLNDPEYKALAYRKIVTKQFPTAMTEDCFILMTVG